MQPINYLTDVASPFETALYGFTAGAGVRQILDARAKAEADQARTQQQQEDLAALAGNPNATGADYARVMTMHPELSENLKRSWEAMNADQQKNTLSHRAQVFTALRSGKSDVAEQLLRESANAKRASGMEDDARADEMMAEMVRTSPETALTSAGTWLSAVPGGERIIESAVKLGGESRAAAEEARKAELHPLEVQGKQVGNAKTAAEAQKAGAEAKYADQTIRAELEKKGVEVKKLYADMDIAKQNARIAAMNAATAREGNGLKKQELQLKVNEAIEKRDATAREKVAKAEADAGEVDNALNTINRIKNNQSLDGVLGVLAGRMPGLTGGASDAVALIDTLRSQNFLARVPLMAGTGQLTEIEGKKLEQSLVSLERTQTPKQFRENLDEASRLLNKARTNISRKTGVQLQAPDTPAAKDEKGGPQKTVTVDW